MMVIGKLSRTGKPVPGCFGLHRMILAALVLGMLSAAEAATALAKLPPNASLHRLDNGMEVLLLHIPDAPMVGMNVQVRVGSAMEGYQTSGMCHMLEHLLFNGTTKLDQQAFYAATDRIGAYNNANTGRSHTNYMMLVPRTDLATGMDLQAQMLFQSVLPPAKFEKERGIVLEELAQGADDPAGAAEELWEDFLLAGSSHALPVLGTPSTIRHLDRDRVWDFYRSWYVPNNMLLSVVGGFDPATVMDEVKRWYGEAAPVDLPAWTARPLVWKPGEVRVRHSTMPVRRLRLAWPAPDLDSPGHLEAGLLAWAAGDPRDGVLPMLCFAQGLPPLGDLRLSHVDDVGFGRFELEAVLPDSLDALEAIQGLTQALAGLKDFPFADDAIALRLKDERATLAQLMEKPHYFGLMQAASFAQQGFEPVLTRGSRLAQLGPADLQACAGRWLNSDPPMALLLEPVPDMSAAAGPLDASDELREAAGPGQPALLLKGGRPSDIFALQIVVRGRAVWEGDSAAGAMNLMHQLMPDGAAGQDAAAISRRLRAVGGKLMVADNPAIPYDDHYTSSSHTFLRLEALGEHWQSACSLAVDLLLRPNLDEADFNLARNKQLQQLVRQDRSARARSRQLLDGTLLAGHPAAVPPEGREESLHGLEREDLLRLQGLAFRPENLILSAVGPAPAKEMAECLRGLLAPFSNAPSADDLAWLGRHSPWAPTWQETPPFQAPRLQVPLTKAALTLRESLGGEMSALRLGATVAIDPADGPALRLLFAVLSDRLSFDLREERGWAYSIGCWASPHGERATLEAYMGTRGENVEPALRELTRYLSGSGKPIDQAELDKVRGGMLGRELMRGLASINQAWLRAMGELAGDAEASSRDETALRSVGPADLKRVSQRYLKDVPWITVVVE